MWIQASINIENQPVKSELLIVFFIITVIRLLFPQIKSNYTNNVTFIIIDLQSNLEIYKNRNYTQKKMLGYFQIYTENIYIWPNKMLKQPSI